MSARSQIPEKIREQLSDDVFMADCVVAGWDCDGGIQWHHAFTSKGKRVNEIWSILPLCAKHHKEMTKHTKVICDMNLRARIAHFKAFNAFKRDYPKSDLFKV